MIEPVKLDVFSGAVASEPLYLEDLSPGQKLSFGDYHVTREEIIDFASRYDPQPFHLDDEAAAANPLLGKLCASGMHTMSMSHLLQMRGFAKVGINPLAGAGMDELRLYRPVFPGDTIHSEIEITQTREIRSKADRGLLDYLTTVLNQHGEKVMTYRSTLFMARRSHRN